MATKEIAAAVRYLRKQNNLSQEKLANIAGVGKTVIFDIEKGKKTIRFDTLLKVFSVLNIDFNIKTPLKIPSKQ